MKHSPHILLINPWIADFAAYDFWIKPLGLLHIASLLRRNGCRVTLIDCLDFHTKTNEYGAGKFCKTKIEKPLPIRFIRRHYGLYGLPESILREKISCIEKPDVICITCGMTYWYPGLFKAIRMAKDFFKRVPVIVGGIYATLCYEHALRNSGADYIIPGRGDLELLKLLSSLTGFEFRNPHSEFRSDSCPAFDLYPHLNYVSMMTSRGCPFHCTYCASHFLSPKFSRKNPFQVVEEINQSIVRYHINNIAFYDDALLAEPEDHIVPILKEIIGRGIQCNFHTPNGLHVREIDRELAYLLFRAGFKTIRFGLETSDEGIQIDTGGKVDNSKFREAVENLKRAGYSGEKIGVYVMAGLPAQRVEEVEESIAFVRGAGARSLLTEYSPIPHTPLFEKAKRMPQFDLENEPLFHNNSIFPCQWEGFTLGDLKSLKEGLQNK